MAPAQLRAGAGWVHVRPLRQPSPPGNQPATLLIRPNPQGGSSSLPMIGRRLPASSSFVLARAGRRGLRALQLDPARATAQPAATRKSHKTVPPRNPAAASGGHRVRPPRPLDNRGLHGCGDVTAFLTGESRRLAPKTVQRVATALRSLLRFWHLQGLTGGPLDRAVPKAANRRPGLPRPLEQGQVAALLASCDQQTAMGRRDLAMLTLLARLGLRAGEVAGLTLDDIDWRSGEISIAGKGGRRDRLPLPADAGQAIAAWLLHGRPARALDRSVFIRARAPRSGLTAGAVTQAVAAAAQRAGLGAIYAHRLRHSAATAMLAGGGSLAEIGQVLRHRRAQTTSAYTKVNIEALRTLARPWPGALS